jgi:hypothetical protein
LRTERRAFIEKEREIVAYSILTFGFGAFFGRVI